MDEQNASGKGRQNLSDSLKHLSHSTSGGNILVFLICLGIATVFWLFLSLYDEVERDYDIPFEVESVPDSIVIVEPLPSAFSVVVQGKGVQFLKFLWHDVRPLRVNFNDYSGTSGQFAIPRQKLDGLMRDYFGQGIKVTGLRPESVKAAYTSNIGRKVPVEVITDIQPKMQYVISGPVRVNVDSVMLYSANELPRDLQSVSTYPLVRSGLKDTMSFIVKIRPIDGVRIIPDQLEVQVPVEPLISKKRTVPVDVVNAPVDVKLLTFPSVVEVTYLVPMSQYGRDLNVRLFVDYSTIDRNLQKVPVQTTAVPGVFRNFTFNPDSVEYIIETQQQPDILEGHSSVSNGN